MTEVSRRAPIFPAPKLLELSEKDKIQIAEVVTRLYREETQRRIGWKSQHLLYDSMFRGDVGSGRTGPWKNSSNFHVPMPYWLVDSINTRMVSGIWGQNPLVSGSAEEDDDQEIFRNAVALVDWHFQAARMNARLLWSIISKQRCIHGFGVGLLTYAHTEYSYTTEELQDQPDLQFGLQGQLLMDPVTLLPQLTPVSPKRIMKKGVKYDGPVLCPVEWDDVIVPQEGNNLQPKGDDNPLGTDWVGIRQWEPLSLIWKRHSAEKPYGYIAKDLKAKDREFWIKNAPSQDRSSSGSGGDNQARAKQQDRYEGRNRQPVSRKTAEDRPNPEFEILRWFMPWEVTNEAGEKVEQECVFFVCIKPKFTLGAYLLADISWQGDRPLLDLHYQRVGTRFYSMGVMEIARHMSAELDTLHNMRIDVGMATNLPFFFYRASSAFDPNKIELSPLKGVPVDDINDVRFPQLQNVTTFYYQEEQLLYTLVERVMGVTDLFLGISPTRGAAARHATGFVGTQQEALARTSETLSQDAEAFSFMCRMVYNMELQYGPAERLLRLQGKEGPITQKLNREQLWMRGNYDFRLGANAGMFSSALRQQQGQAILQTLQGNPFLMQDPGRMWELWNFIYYSMGLPDPALFLGPKSAVAAGSPRAQDEENGQMAQFTLGVGIPATVHPADNDQEHVQQLLSFISSPEYMSLGKPNLEAFMKHVQLHVAQMQMKQQQMQLQQAGGKPGLASQPRMPGAQMLGQQGPALGQERIEPQLQGKGNMGAMGDLEQASNGKANSFAPPPRLPVGAGR